MIYTTIPAALRAARRFHKAYGMAGSKYVCQREQGGFSVLVFQRAQAGHFYFATII